jgi:hypothetical protein
MPNFGAAGNARRYKSRGIGHAHFANQFTGWLLLYSGLKPHTCERVDSGCLNLRRQGFQNLKEH